MDNSINNISFRANLKSLVPVKNTKRYENICKKFADETKQFTDEKFDLYISSADSANEAQGNKIMFHLKNSIEDLQKDSGYAIENVNTYLEKMSDTVIAKKLAKLMQLLYYENLYRHSLPDFKKEIENAIKVADKKITNLSTIDKEENKSDISYIKGRITRLKNQYLEFDNTIRSNLYKIAKGDAELEKRISTVL